MSVLRIIDTSGDTEVLWQVKDAVALENARTTFNDMIKAGYLAYAIGHAPATEGAIVGHKVSKNILYSFDEQADEIVMTPLLRGG